MPEPAMHPDGRGRAVASSSSGAQLYTGYRVQHTRSLDAVGVIATITPDGDRVAVTWPNGNTTWHRGYNLCRVGTVQENEQHPETRAGYPPDPRLAAEQVTIDEQCWVELTRAQVEDLLRMVSEERTALLHRTIEKDEPLRQARHTELLLLKGQLLLGRDDPGAIR